MISISQSPCIPKYLTAIGDFNTPQNWHANKESREEHNEGSLD